MATPSTTIRVPVPTRDRLAAQAQSRGISLAALLDDMSLHAERAAAFDAERAATRSEARLATVGEEDLDWADTTADGLD